MQKRPFRVRFGKTVIECDTPEHAAQVARQLEADSPYTTTWRVDEFMDFVDKIQIQQRRLLAAMLKHEKSYYSDQELRERLGLGGNQALAGVLSGVTKIAQSMDIEPKRIYGQDVKYKQGQPNRRYWLNTEFRKAAENADWPSEGDSEESEE